MTIFQNKIFEPSLKSTQCKRQQWEFSWKVKHATQFFCLIIISSCHNSIKLVHKFEHEKSQYCCFLLYFIHILRLFFLSPLAFFLPICVLKISSCFFDIFRGTIIIYLQILKFFSSNLLSILCQAGSKFSSIEILNVYS